jgi:peptidoglycan/LPS O-acetylase OafA/YrhL
LYWLPSVRTLPRALLAFAIAFTVALAIYKFVELPSARLRKRLGRSAHLARVSALVR